MEADQEKKNEVQRGVTETLLENGENHRISRPRRVKSQGDRVTELGPESLG